MTEQSLTENKNTVCQSNSRQILDECSRLILKYAPKPGVFATAVPGLSLYHIETNSFIERCSGELMATFIVYGRKSTAIGNKVFEYGPGESLVCGVASPSEFHTIGASPQHPFLALAVPLDLSLLMEYAVDLSSGSMESEMSEVTNGVMVIRPDKDLAMTFLSLLRLLERPNLVSLRAPLYLRDMHALLLDSSFGPGLRSLASVGSKGHAVMKVIQWVRANYAKDCGVEKLASNANMSSATFHRYFKQVTGFSPIQYRKRVRLFEARRLLLSQQKNVTSIAFSVGYDSTAQFVRDYKDLFGEPPLRDIKRLVEVK